MHRTAWWMHLARGAPVETAWKKTLFDFEGSKRATVCAEHAEGGMVDIARMCAHGGIHKEPSSRVDDVGDIQFGAEDAQTGMDSLRVRMRGAPTKTAPLAQAMA